MRPPIHVYLPGFGQLILDQLRRALPTRQFIVIESRRAFVDAMPEMQLLICWDPPRNRWAQAPDLRLIQLGGAGVDSVLPAPDLSHDVIICNAKGTHEPQMPEFVMAMVFALAYKVPDLVKQQLQHRWQQSVPRPLTDQTMCVVGLGEIGQSIAKRASALGMRVVGVRNSGTQVPGVEHVVRPDERLFALEGADVTVVCVPLTQQTKGLIGPNELNAMSRGSTLVDVSRGGVVYLDSVIAALESGQLSGAALDVFRTEPLPPEHPAWDVDGLLITPHTAGLSRDYLRRVAETFASNLSVFEGGQTPKNAINRDLGY